ncbi:hypothetical protein ONZ43_g1330 [Nemania bipapillata]|uniref:Uncharacterized protein n=1 Tax=Nemania bipapillata TaxID=110536 RepID=A0ACC2J4W7_9PEZI|nr:hypothetical protein ONZ43_g1330 [Nemania bipapillata]
MADTNHNNETGQRSQSTMEWAKEKYNEQYEAWMPWIEDMFLKYFTKDNRTSYVARDQLDKTKVTGIEQVDALQDGANNLAASQLGQGGILQPIGDLGSEGMKLVDPRGKGRGKGGDDNKGPNVPIISGLGL